MDSLGVYLSAKYLLNFYQTCTLHHDLGKLFELMVLRLLENAFMIQNIESIYFYSLPFSLGSTFLRIYFSPVEREERKEIIELKK